MATRPFFETLREIRRGQILDDCADELAQQADPDPEPDLETVELKDLLDAVRCFLDDGQAIVIRAESDSVTIKALNEAQFVCSTADARDVLDHATALGLHLVMF